MVNVSSIPLYFDHKSHGELSVNIIDIDIWKDTKENPIMIKENVLKIK